MYQLVHVAEGVISTSVVLPHWGITLKKHWYDNSVNGSTGYCAEQPFKHRTLDSLKLVCLDSGLLWFWALTCYRQDMQQADKSRLLPWHKYHSCTSHRICIDKSSISIIFRDPCLLSRSRRSRNRSTLLWCHNWNASSHSLGLDWRLLLVQCYFFDA